MSVLAVNQYAGPVVRSASAAPTQPALDTGAVSKLSGVPISTLNYWVSLRLCRPSLLGPAGHRLARYWSAQDLLTVRVVRALRASGCSLQKVRRAKQLVEAGWAAGFESTSLIYDGEDVLIVTDPHDRVISAIKEPGQGMFESMLTVVNLPLGMWAQAAKDAAAKSPIDLAAVRAHRRLVDRSRSSEPSTRVV